MFQAQRDECYEVFGERKPLTLSYFRAYSEKDIFQNFFNQSSITLMAKHEKQDREGTVEKTRAPPRSCECVCVCLCIYVHNRIQQHIKRITNHIQVDLFQKCKSEAI